MDTKLKKFSHSLFIKGLVFILVILSFAGILTLVVDNFIIGEISPEVALDSGSYLDSSEFNSRLNRVINNIDVLLNYRIPSTGHGQSTEKDQDNNYDEETDNWHYDKWYIENVISYLISLDGVIYFASNGLVDYTNIDGINQGQIYRADGLRSYMTANNRFMHELLADRGIWESYPLYLISQANSSIYIKPNTLTNYDNYNWINNSYQNNYGAVYIAYSDEYLTKQMASWEAKRYAGQQAAGIIFVLAAVLVLSFIYLLAVVGRNHFRDREVDLDSLDRLYTEINLILCAALIGGWGIFTANVWSYMNGQRLTGQVTGYMSPNFWLFFLVTAVIATLGLILVLSLVRNFKNRTLIKSSLVFKFLAFLYRNSIGVLQDLYRHSSSARKIGLAVLAYSFLILVGSMFIATLYIQGIGKVFLSLIFLAALVTGLTWLLNRRFVDFETIKAGIREIGQGNLKHQVQMDKKSNFYELAQDVNNISQGMSQAVDNELKSERMKTELITNVSHDIRTPLTSIISYIGLAKSEADREKQEEYLDIIEQKSLRLKSLTDDLFEAAKATSGSMPVELSQIDIIALIDQGLGELDAKISAHELDFRFQHPGSKLLVLADGKLVWRAVENLLSNIFKYAQTGSRVYIEARDLGPLVELTFKNVSAEELNISPDQLMERFVRGDEARSSQGSGLGLSITRSLIEIQGGDFKLEIDGDLFKAIIILPKGQDVLVKDKVKEDSNDVDGSDERPDVTAIDDSLSIERGDWPEQLPLIEDLKIDSEGEELEELETEKNKIDNFEESKEEAKEESKEEMKERREGKDKKPANQGKNNL